MGYRLYEATLRLSQTAKLTTIDEIGSSHSSNFIFEWE